MNEQLCGVLTLNFKPFLPEFGLLQKLVLGFQNAIFQTPLVAALGAIGLVQQ